MMLDWLRHPIGELTNLGFFVWPLAIRDAGG
jgi:hypothetical protein